MKNKIRKSCEHHEGQNFSECVGILDVVVEKLIKQGAVNDDAYAEGMVNSYRNKGLSSKMILSKLQYKSLPIDVISLKIRKKDAFTEEISNDIPAELIAAIKMTRKKRIGAFSNGSKTRDKELAILARNGFSYDIAQKALDIGKEEAERIIGIS